MLTLTKDTVIREMSAENKPVAYVNSGESVRFLTMDAMGDQYVVEDEYIIDESKGGNPATGPVYVNGAEPGDTLKVTVEQIKVNSVVSMTTAPNYGVFADEIPVLKRAHYKIDENNILHFNDKLSFPIRPMLGVLGVAPRYGAQPNATPYEHGGNMDCKEITEGSIVYFPVFHPGALVATGDVHALMGDGEVCICGAEVAADVVLKLEIVPQKIDTIMIVQPDKVMTVCSANTVDEAASKACRYMRKFLEEQVGMEFHESCRVLSLVGDMRICEVVDPKMCCRMEVPREVFDAYGYRFA